MSKEHSLMVDIIAYYHPDFVQSDDLQKLGVSKPHIFKVEHLIEECMAAVGPYTFTDGAHEDFSDGTECKTASTWYVSANREAGEISNVVTAGGSKKAGDIRCVIYINYTGDLKYYYLPKSFWEKNITYHNSSNIGKIKFKYNTITDTIDKFVGYECKDFVELCNK